MKRKASLIIVCLSLLIAVLGKEGTAQRRQARPPRPARPAEIEAPPQKPAPPVIIRSYDAASDKTLVATKSYRLIQNRSDVTLAISAAYLVTGKEINRHPDGYVLLISSLANRYQFVDYADLKILVDGNPLNFGRMLRRPSVNNGLAEENLSILTLPPVMIALTRGQRLDLEVGLLHDVNVPVEFILALRELVASAPPYDPSAPAVTTTVEKKRSPCTIDRAPDLRGFKLGMSPQQALGRFNGLTLAPQDNIPRGYTPPTYPTRETYGQAIVRLNVFKFSDWEPYAVKNRSFMSEIAQGNYTSDLNARYFTDLGGIRSIVLTFVDQKLAAIEFSYTDEIKWASTEEFARKSADALGLNGDLSAGRYSSGYQLNCQGFSIEAGSGYPGMTIKLIDTAQMQVVADRKKRGQDEEDRQKQQQKEGFRP